ncbi:MAG: hypothetical protein D9V47_04280 [Clostridia bacterium]|nr:MAG: hypothetical protein D9V47_04280 [Clostridia bacterium]
MYPYECNRGLIILLGSVIVLAIFLAFTPAVAFAEEGSQSQKNAQCLQCHGQPQLSAEVDGQKVSLYVDQKQLQQTVHAGLDCASCHQGKDKLPHADVKYDLALAREVQAACQTCHAGIAEDYKKSIHAQTGVATCSSCHGSHDILPVSDPASKAYAKNLPETCGSCHEKQIIESYEESFHGKAISLGSTQAASCVSCHGSHDILPQDDPASRVARANIPQTCAQCHQTPQTNFAAGIEHFELAPEGPGMPMYYTFKFFTWLTILAMTLLIIHMELELYRRLKDTGRSR